MTRKHYVMIAEAIQQVKTDRMNLSSNIIRIDEASQTARCLAECIGTQLAQDNNRFDYERFMKACGFGGDK